MRGLTLAALLYPEGARHASHHRRQDLHTRPRRRARRQARRDRRSARREGRAALPGPVRRRPHWAGSSRSGRGDRAPAGAALHPVSLKARSRCCGQICPQQHCARKRRQFAHAGCMAQEEQNQFFTERARLSLLQRRILVLDGVLDDDNGTLLATQLLSLADEDPDADVALWINSPGGSVPSMLAIRDLMRLVPCDVTTLALGIACSAGQFLLSAGTKGKRFALPHSRILMHQGSAGIGG